MNKKSVQLGMNPSTASARLLKDILFKFVVETGNDKCFHCGKPITRETLSVEHKTPWLDSENPQTLFFDLDNIAFSHLACNTGAARKPRKTREEILETRRLKSRRHYDPSVRRERYLRNEK